MKSKDLLELAVKAVDNKRAENIVALDVHEVSLMADYFLIADASSKRQVQSIADSVIEAAHKEDLEIKSVEGKNEANWILVDLGDVIVHIFNKDERQHYNLEKLWSAAPIVTVDDWVNA